VLTVKSFESNSTLAAETTVMVFRCGRRGETKLSRPELA